MDSEFFHQTSNSMLQNLDPQSPHPVKENLTYTTACVTPNMGVVKTLCPFQLSSKKTWQCILPQKRQRFHVALIYSYICFSLLSSRCARGGILSSRSRTYWEEIKGVPTEQTQGLKLAKYRGNMANNHPCGDLPTILWSTPESKPFLGMTRNTARGYLSYLKFGSDLPFQPLEKRH